MKHLNRLASSTSPYLLQHKHDLIDWYPWGTDALHAAQQHHTPIFLSIGYSSCHWCHVQHHLSFQNESVIELLNKHFICIKVDKEQRPDIDSMFMDLVVGLTGSGGHPMSIFTTPDLKPIYGGTYYPPEVFKSILRQILTQWKNNREDVVESAKKMYQSLSSGNDYSKISVPEQNETPQRLIQHYMKRFDTEFGGFSKEPKFPSVPQLLTLYKVCLGAISGISDPQKAASWSMLSKTLTCMRNGGIYDQLESGFHRYSVDRSWLVPHFEKMLYDQSQLLDIYAKATALAVRRNDKRADLFQNTIYNVFEYLNIRMKSEMGGYFTAEDADSMPLNGERNVEGAFCVWSEDELESILNDSQFKVIKYYYGIESSGNVPKQYDHQDELKHKNILMVCHSIEEIEEKFGMGREEVLKVLKKCKDIMYKYRTTRPRPFRDEKIVTCWNAMLVWGFLSCYKTTSDAIFKQHAIDLLDFILLKLKLPDCYKLWRDYKHDENPSTMGFAYDYACVIKALLEFYYLEGDLKYLNLALEFQSQQDALFWDQDEGDYFTSTEDPYIIRGKDVQDGAEPSTQTISLENLLSLSMATSREEFLEKADRMTKIYLGVISQAPHAVIGLSGVILTQFRKITINKKDYHKISEILRDSVYPTILSFEDKLDGNFIECLGETCFDKKPITDFQKM
eukprot:NODE_78_length_23230_cov_1.644979.p4 type:complete len:678 gc:universal NODE_78_length_23230_cov_1.644979:21150-23183(+)